MRYQMTTDASNRRYELDWIRVLAILIVFLYHSTRFFNLGEWHVKNINTYVLMEIWIIFSNRWMMPLFFIISGASLFYAIGKSGGWRRFYEDKFLRLMIPVLLASVTHGALQVYLERVTHGHFSGSFFSFLPDYFDGVYSGIGFVGNFAFSGMHLWYLFFLFLYSLVCYRLFVWLKGSGQEILNRITKLFAIPGLIYIWFSIPLLILKALIPQEVLNVGSAGWAWVYHLLFLISGFMIASSDRLQRTIKNQRWISLLLGVVISAVYLYLLFGVSSVLFPGRSGDWINTLFTFFSAWTWLFAILGFGMHFLSFDRPILKYTNEGVLPFFIMHQTVLLGIGYFIMTWKIHDALKWVIVFFSSFIVIMALYILIVRKFELFRFLFGLKTSHSFFDIFRKKSVIIILLVILVGLTVFAGFNPKDITGKNLPSGPLTYAPGQDIIFNAKSITGRSSTGVRVVDDEKASMGQAIEFTSGANQRPKTEPGVYVDIDFSAPAGRYIVWLRGKGDTDSIMTDSVWFQVDGQVGTRKGSQMGNWLNIQPVGVYGWASNHYYPLGIVLNHTGEHKIRIQPRQTTHRIDQIWLSKYQRQIPDTNKPVK